MPSMSTSSQLDPSLLSRKTKSAMGARMNEAASEAVSDFGRRMLAKFGWSEGKGLGKHEDGMRSHLRVEQREELAGLGSGSASTGPAELPTFDNVKVKKRRAKADGAKSAKRAKRAAAREQESSSSSDESEDADEARRRAQIASGVVPGMSDADLFKICGGARLGMRARAEQNGKQRRMAEADAAFREKYGAKAGGGPDSAAAAGAARSSAAGALPADGAGSEQQRDKPEAAQQKAAVKAAVKAARKEARKAERKAERKAARKAARRAAGEGA